MRVEVERVIAHSVDRVFAVVSDPPSRPRWQENTSGVEVLTPEPTGLGTRWREQSKGIGTVTAEVVGFEPGRLWEESGTADGGAGRITVRMEPEGEESTRVQVVVELHLKGLRRVMEGALEPIVARQLPKDLSRLEALLDAGGAPPG
ncbi:MAG: SRPBCC family protein [Thermoleophilia bacterium]|nr:SRPBCC family protein [Thermoleophilia bacterium]